jgi:hypothetical protein
MYFRRLIKFEVLLRLVLSLNTLVPPLTAKTGIHA